MWAKPLARPVGKSRFKRTTRLRRVAFGPSVLLYTSQVETASTGRFKTRLGKLPDLIFTRSRPTFVTIHYSSVVIQVMRYMTNLVTQMYILIYSDGPMQMWGVAG